MTDVPVYSEGDVDQSEYWRFQLTGVEWQYVIYKLIRQFKLDELAPSERAVLIHQNQMLLLKKKFVPASAVIKATGFSLEDLERLDRLVLKVSKKDLPEPTVTGWGEA